MIEALTAEEREQELEQLRCLVAHLLAAHMHSQKVGWTPIRLVNDCHTAQTITWDYTINCKYNTRFQLVPAKKKKKRQPHAASTVPRTWRDLLHKHHPNA